MSEGVPQLPLETYWGPKPPLTVEAFRRIADEQIASVVLVPRLVGPSDRKALGVYEEIAHLDDGDRHPIDLFRITVSADQSRREQEITLAHEIAHIYQGGLVSLVWRQKVAPPGIEEYLKKEEAQAESEAQRFYLEHPDLVTSTFDRLTVAQPDGVSY